MIHCNTERYTIHNKEHDDKEVTWLCVGIGTAIN